MVSLVQVDLLQKSRGAPLCFSGANRRGSISWKIALSWSSSVTCSWTGQAHTVKMHPESDQHHVLSLCSIFSSAAFKCIPTHTFWVSNCFVVIVMFFPIFFSCTGMRIGHYHTAIPSPPLPAILVKMVVVGGCAKNTAWTERQKHTKG